MKRKGILVCLIFCLLMSGCASGKNDPEQSDPESEQSGEVTPLATVFGTMIVELQQAIANLKTTQLEQNAAYEKRISELEALVSGDGRGNGAPGESTTVASEYTYIEKDGGILISSYLGRDTKVQIPSEIDGKKVTGIGESAFRNSAVEQVIIPDGVVTVGWFAFYGSYKLSSVVIPASVTTIEYGAFELCSSSIRFICPTDSYAAQYAHSYGISVAAG